MNCCAVLIILGVLCVVSVYPLYYGTTYTYFRLFSGRHPYSYPRRLETEMTTLVINLDSATERWNQVRGHLTGIGLSPVRLSAVDGKSANTKGELYERYGFPRLECMSDANDRAHVKHLACYLSHVLALRRASVSSSRNWTLICEDDVRFEHGGVFVQNMINSIINDAHPRDIVWLNARSSPPGANAEAYMVTRNGARKLLEHLEPGSEWAASGQARRTCLYDWALFDICSQFSEIRCGATPIATQNKSLPSQIN